MDHVRTSILQATSICKHNIISIATTITITPIIIIVIIIVIIKTKKRIKIITTSRITTLASTTITITKPVAKTRTNPGPPLNQATTGSEEGLP